MSSTLPQTAAASPAASPVQTDGTRKAAILMMSLGQEVSGEILKRLKEDEVRRIAAEITRIQALTPEQAEQVLAEFHRTIAGGSSYTMHGADFAKDMLVNALGAEPARKVLDQVSRQANMDAVLATGNPLIIGIHAYGGTHYIVFTSGSKGNYIMRDPYQPNAKDIPFTQYYSLSEIFSAAKVVIS